MAICISCRADPCRCAPGALEVRLDDEPAAIGLARALSPAYAAWILGGEVGPEPIAPADVRRRVRDLLKQIGR